LIVRRSRLLIEQLERRLLLNGLPTQVIRHQLTVDNGGANYVAGDADSFVLPQFDDQGGTRTLQSVQVEITANALNGAFSLDSEDANPGSASLEFGAQVDVVSDTGASVLTVTATPTETNAGLLAPDDEVGAADHLGPDHIEIDLATTSTSEMQQSNPLFAGTDDLSAFLGGGNVSFDFTSASIATHTEDVAPISLVSGPVDFNFDVALTYTYVPQLPLETQTFTVTVDNGGANYAAGDGGSFVLPQFNTQGGNLVLYSVQLQIDANALNGSFELDSEDGGSAGTATLTLGVDVAATSASAPDAVTVTASPSETTTGAIAIDNDAAPDFVGTDSLTLTFASTSATELSNTLNAVANDLAPFLGTGNVTYNFTSASIADHVEDVAPVFLQGGAADFNFVATVTYLYTPQLPLATEQYTVVVDNSGANFDAGDSGSFAVPQFDDHGGARTLQGVYFELTTNALDGLMLFDSEDPSDAGTATLTIGADIDVTGALVPVSVTVTLSESDTGPVTADTDAAPDYVGTDSLGVQFATLADLQSFTYSSPPDDLSGFIGAGNVTFDFTSNSIAVHSEDVGPVSIFTLGPQFNFVATIRYTYVPEPAFQIVKGVVATDSATAHFTGPIGPVAFSAPGSAGLRFTGTIDSASLAALTVNSNLDRASANDRVSFAIVVENVGGGIQGAYDMRISDTIPPGFSVPPGGLAGLNLFVSDGTGAAIAYTRGDGAALADPMDFFTPGLGIELVDPGPTVATGSLDAYNPISARNLVVITYDLVLDPDVSPGDYVNTATAYYGTWAEGQADLLVPDISDPAVVTVRADRRPPEWDVFLRGPAEEQYPPIERTFQPLFSGTAEPGATLEVNLYDSQGDLIGTRSVLVDAGGNWVANFPDTNVGTGAHTLTIRQAYTGYDPFGNAGYGLRTYFAPAIMGGTYVSEPLTVANVVGKRAIGGAIDRLYAESLYPIQLGWPAQLSSLLPLGAVVSGY
jgi:hypothetical protein